MAEKMGHRPRNWTDNDLINAVKVSCNYSDVLRKLNLVIGGGNPGTIKKYIKRLNIDTSHFNLDARLNKLTPFKSIYTDDEVYCVNSKFQSQGGLRRKVIRDEFLPYICAICHCKPIHNGKSLTLQLDHENGAKSDNRKENLRWLCPNCHSQTETFCGRNLPGSSNGKTSPFEGDYLGSNPNPGVKAFES